MSNTQYVVLRDDFGEIVTSSAFESQEELLGRIFPDWMKRFNLASFCRRQYTITFENEEC